MSVDTVAFAENEMPVCRLATELQAMFCERGVARSAFLSGQSQEEKEKETYDLYPSSYAMWCLSDEEIEKKYRHSDGEGRPMMDVESYLRYFADCRGDLRLPTSCAEASDLRAEEQSVALCAPVSNVESRRSLNRRDRKKLTLKERFYALLAEWVVPVEEILKSEPKAEKKKANVKAGAKASTSVVLIVAAVFMSLMMIVASSVMISTQNNRVNEKKSELQTLQEDCNALATELETKTNLLAIRDTAVNELGMIDEGYVSMEKLAADSGETIENYEVKKEEGTILSTILSAIGIR